MTDLLDRARELDAADPLHAHLDAFADAPGVSAYLDGNSLGRPLRDIPEKIAQFVREDWGTRLIRSWDEQWMALPMELGDRIGALALGAAPGQTVVADSTSVLIYKLLRAALRQAQGTSGAAQGSSGAALRQAQGPSGAAQGTSGTGQGSSGAALRQAQGPSGAAQGPSGTGQGTSGAAQGTSGETRRDEIVMEAGNFPTDRFLVAGVAAETGMTVRWIEPDPVHGVTVADVQAVVSDRTALVSLSHVDYRSGALADMPAITDAVHAAGALMMWDLCHSVGVVPMQLDAWGVDLAVGCTYKYLNGGPGSPAFAYLRRGLQGVLQQPIHGWWSASDIFAMGPEYVPSDDIRQLLSGTPPVTSMLAMQGMLDLIEDASIGAVRAKSIALTDFAVQAYDEVLAPLGVRLLSPRDAAVRGGHVTIGHPDFRAVTARLWDDGIIPDFRFPDGIRLGLSPLSTSFAETAVGVLAIRDALRA